MPQIASTRRAPAPGGGRSLAKSAGLVPEGPEIMHPEYNYNTPILKPGFQKSQLLIQKCPRLGWCRSPGVHVPALH
eukprot:8677817-Heterocapsa_arctica.AAC.1